MQESQNQDQIKSSGLWAPFTIIGIGFILSLIFVFKTLKDYKTPKPLLIKPSSVETTKDIHNALYKSLYPLKLRGFGVTLASPKNETERTLFSYLAKSFKQSKNADKNESKNENIKFSTQSIDLSQKADIDKTDCKNTALFNLRRKIKKWDKEIYFAVCTESKNEFVLFYILKDKN